MKHSFLQAGLLGLLCTLAWPAWATFTDNNNGTITDNTTGLIWDKCPRGQNWDNTAPPGTCTGSGTIHAWAHALAEATAANTVNHLGYNDWRLPNRTELESLVKIDAVNPSIDATFFPATVPDWYWSSTSFKSNPTEAWRISFHNGYAGTGGKGDASGNRVRLVRGGVLSGEVDALDTTAPTLNPLAVTGTTATTTTLQATSNEAVTGYWVALPQGSGVPSAAQVKAGQDSGGNAVALAGNDAMAAGTQKDFAVTGLAQSTPYTLYLVAEDGWSNLSTVSSTNVTTQTPVNGACGSADGVATLVAPAANLCSAGVDGGVSSAAAAFTWSCAGTGGGSTSMCSAPRQYSVTPAHGAGGSMSPGSAQVVTYSNTTSFTVTPSGGYAIGAVSGCSGALTGNTYTTGDVVADCTVNASFVPLAYAITATASPPAGGLFSCTPNSVGHGSTSTCTAVPATGYRTQSISGCNGTATGVGTNTYTTGAVTGACTVTANFVQLTYVITATANPPAGGTASCMPSPVNHGSTATCTPTANAGYMFTGWGGDCSGTAASCTLANVTADKTVSASFAAVQTSFAGTTVPGAGGTTGAASASFTGGGATCSFDGASTAFVAAPAALPAGQTMPHGMFQFKLVGCTPGATVTMSVTWPQAVQGLTKWGKATSAGDPNTHFTPTGLVVSGNITTFTVQDGQKGDDDWAADGTIVDPVGPIVAGAPGPGPGGAHAIPTLGEWSLVLLSLLAAALGMGTLRRRGVQRV